MLYEVITVAMKDPNTIAGGGSVFRITSYNVCYTKLLRQKQKWLGKIAAGEALVAYAVTEPDAGSNVASIKTKADPVLNDAGEITGYRITSYNVCYTKLLRKDWHPTGASSCPFPFHNWAPVRWTISGT